MTIHVFYRMLSDVNRCGICGETKYHPIHYTNSYCETVDFEEIPMIPYKIEKKFYVGSNTVFAANNTHLKATVAEAIEHAKQLVDTDGEDRFIVQIVRVVRRAKPPIKVQKV